MSALAPLGMVDLPLELIGEIIVRVDREPDDALRQTTLAALARTCRTLNRVVGDRLYLEPVFTSKQSLEKWWRRYSPRVTPWSRARGGDSFGGLIHSRAITFAPTSTFADEASRRPPARIHDTISTILQSDLYLRSVLAKHLTSFTVAPGSTSFAPLLTSLLGPKRTGRQSITHLSLRGADQERPLLFLLEASCHFMAEADHDTVTKAAYRRRDPDWEEDTSEHLCITDEEWRFEEQLLRNEARTDFSAFRASLVR